MESVETKLAALFNAAGMHYEALSYCKTREAGNERTDVELKVMQDLLTALAPFKERLLNLKVYDV